MNAPTTPLRTEHRELLPHIEQLRLVADHVGRTSIESLRTQVADSYEFLAHHLIPHAMAEDETLYPVVAKLMGSPDACATMSRDHVAVRQLVDELSAARTELGTELSIAVANELRRTLYGLHALVKVHFAKEEEIYLPLLDARLTLAEAEEMFSKMERSAARAKELIA